MNHIVLESYSKSHDHLRKEWEYVYEEQGRTGELRATGGCWGNASSNKYVHTMRNKNYVISGNYPVNYK